MPVFTNFGINKIAYGIRDSDRDATSRSAVQLLTIVDRHPVFRYTILQIDLTKYQQSVGSKYAFNIHHFKIAYLVI